MKHLPLFDRDLSWLTFNYRVLMEAEDPDVPLIERLRFAAIFSSNLDEFFRVRVASMRSLVEIDKKKINKQIEIDPKEVLQQIQKEVGTQLSRYGKVLRKILSELKKEGVSISYTGRIRSADRKPLFNFFRTKLMGYLRIQSLTSDSLFLNNRALYFLITTIEKGKKKSYIINIPSDKVSRFHTIKAASESRIYFIDDIIRENLDMVFLGKEVTGCYCIKLNKDADLQIDDEYEGDLVEKIEKQIKKRNLGVPSRFLYDATIPDEILLKLKEVLRLQDEDMYAGGKYHNLHDFFQVDGFGKNLEYERQIPVRNKELDAYKSIFEAIRQSDQVLHFPYQSYDYIIQFFNEAAVHPDVKNIYVTFYRMAENSMIGEALISAANNGKKVNVFMEVKARFDEENNLQWARKMKSAGIRIHYSIPGLKVHAKTALITMKSSGGETKRLGFYGTGNLNESTAKIYCDHSLLSANIELNKELQMVFDFLTSKKKPKKFKHLIVSQFGALERFKSLINREIENSQAGKEAKIIIKLNNLEEASLIQKLCEAAKAGVEVTLIIRSICCLVPGTEGIQVIRVVDRFLEHSRIFYFHNSGDEDIYMGSSDWMNRNLHRRVEVTFPIYSVSIKDQIKRLLTMQLEDDTKAVRLNKSLQNIRVERGQHGKRAQIDTYDFIKGINKP